MLSPIESSEGLPGDLSAELGVHNPMLTTNWIGFRVEDGLYKLCGSPRYFFMHPENSQVPEPLPGARAALQQHYECPTRVLQPEQRLVSQAWDYRKY